ncbi:hypothetical protein A8709_04900 [Paenibacillus pectinilyticus]|uniref:Right handed beta helix domain-containing protein n=1 Tax=Paenibacillus pectinilyticus TaxID=512399 RepID=A0A1C0ZSP5_9BACL|nr:right-handed parallel beta-helix repeat-containing protein [Paenibacillus pectinilyticus]OCT11043.1 hypothetical protein A8709_04900 [Paenibacillus pectinilyticus]
MNIVATALQQNVISASNDYTKLITRGETIDDLYPLYQKIKADQSKLTYNLELSRWQIYNDNTHPIETTNGFNQALQWAHDQGYQVFAVPAGTYLIAKGNGQHEENARINMVSNMTFQLDSQAIIQKESNNYEGYELFYLGPTVHDVTIKGGTYKGDKDTHDYSRGGTQEFGFGILADGVQNVMIDGVTTTNFTGDGIYIGSHFDVINSLFSNDFESGGIDDQGKLVANSNSIRIKNLQKTRLNRTEERRTVELERPEGITNSDVFDIYFYKADGTFISSSQNQQFYWSYIPIPNDTDYFNATIHESSVVGDNSKVVGGDGIYGMGIYTKSRSEAVSVINSESAFNRRQGITVAGANNIFINNNKLHDMKGTAPQSGIDLEGGVNPNTNVTISQNRFYNNEVYNLILYDGKDAIVTDNIFEKAPIGLAISDPFSGATINNNKFYGSSITVAHDANFNNNHVENGKVDLMGQNVIVNNLELIDSNLAVNSDIPFGIELSNISLTNSGSTNGVFNISGKPIHVTNATFQGPSTRVFGGNVENGSIFDNFKVVFDSSLSLDLPPGTYNNCSFETNSEGIEAVELNNAATYVFNKCSFKLNRTTLSVINKDAVIHVSDSNFVVQKADGYGLSLIDTQSVKEIILNNNTIDARKNTVTYFDLIRMGKLGGAAEQTQVRKAEIRGNTILSKVSVNGISTIDAGTDAPPYTVESNVLHNAKLLLKPNDINSNNKVLSD